MPCIRGKCRRYARPNTLGWGDGLTAVLLRGVFACTAVYDMLRVDKPHNPLLGILEDR